MVGMKIAVMGGGNGAHAMAADLTLKGYEVYLCEHPEFEEAIKTTLERQAIDLIDVWGQKTRVKIAKVTTNFQEAVKGSRYIMLNIPGLVSEKFFGEIMPYLEDGQTVIKWSGYFSALVFSRMLEEANVPKRVILAEAHTLPWGCRLLEPGTVQTMVWVVKMLFATLPARDVGGVIKDIQQMYPVVAAENVLATTLNNLNPVVHPVAAMMNAGAIETVGKDYSFNAMGSTLATARVIKAVFEEVSAVADSIGITMLDYPEEDFWEKGSIMPTYSRAVFDKGGMVGKIFGPSSMKSRYITEDIPLGLVPVARLGHKFEVKTPVINSLIQLASVVNQTDYMATGLSPEDLRIASLDKAELARVLSHGF